MNVNRRDFLATCALGAVAATGIAAIEAKSAKVTITHDLLVSWGACERYRKIFRRDYPDGVTGTAAEIAAIPKAKYDQLWVLHAMAKHDAGQVGADALALLVPRADASRLAKAVIEVKDHDTTAALARLCDSGDAEELTNVILKGTESQAATAAGALVAKASNRALDYAETLLPQGRKALLANARRAH